MYMGKLGRSPAQKQLHRVAYICTIFQKRSSLDLYLIVFRDFDLFFSVI